MRGNREKELALGRWWVGHGASSSRQPQLRAAVLKLCWLCSETVKRICTWLLDGFSRSHRSLCRQGQEDVLGLGRAVVSWASQAVLDPDQLCWTFLVLGMLRRVAEALCGASSSTACLISLLSALHGVAKLFPD